MTTSNKFAVLAPEAVDKLQQYEKNLATHNGQQIILLAYDKEH